MNIVLVKYTHLLSVAEADAELFLQLYFSFWLQNQSL